MNPCPFSWTNESKQILDPFSYNAASDQCVMFLISYLCTVNYVGLGHVEGNNTYELIISNKLFGRTLKQNYTLTFTISIYFVLKSGVNASLVSKQHIMWNNNKRLFHLTLLDQDTVFVLENKTELVCSWYVLNSRQVTEI